MTTMILSQMTTAELDAAIDDNMTEDWNLASNPHSYGMTSVQRKQLKAELKAVRLAMLAELKTR